MLHDPTKVLLGATKSSIRTVSAETGDPTTFKAGLAVRRGSTGALQLEDDSTAALIGISAGRSLAESGKTAVVRKGEGVPLRLKSYHAQGTITIDAYADLVAAGNDTIEVAGVVFTAQSGAVTPGDATFRAATSDEATATSLAAQINAHEQASALVTATAEADEVLIVAKELGAAGNLLTLVYTDEGTDTVGASVTGNGTLEGGIDVAVVGKKVYVNDEGLGCDNGDDDAAATGASYQSGVLTGVDPATSEEVPVALVSMAGGL